MKPDGSNQNRLTVNAAVYNAPTGRPIQSNSFLPAIAAKLRV